MDGTSSQYIILISSLFCCFFPQCSTASAFIPVRAEFTDPSHAVFAVFILIRINLSLYFYFSLLFLSLYIECPLTTIELTKGDRSRNILFITFITDLELLPSPNHFQIHFNIFLIVAIISYRFRNKLNV